MQIKHNFNITEEDGTGFIEICTGNTSFAAAAPIYEQATSNNEISSIAAFPNPFSSFLKLQVKCTSAMPVHIEIAESSGKLLLSETIHLSAGMNEKEINMSSLSPGIYFLAVKGEKLYRVLKIVKQ